MKNQTVHLGRFEVVRRLPSSSNGNPRYLLRVDGWTCRTAPDSGLAYNIGKYDRRQVEAIIGTYYGKATLQSVKLAPINKGER